MSEDDRPWLDLYPEGLGAELDLQHPTLLEAWDAHVAEFPKAPAMLSHGSTLRAAAIDEAADALVDALVGGGLEPGERVGVYLQNDPQWPVVLLAAWRCGAVPVALNPMLKVEELRFHLQDSGTAVLICLESLHRDVAAEAVEGTQVRRVITTHPADLLDPSTSDGRWPAKATPDGADDLAELLRDHRGARPERHRPARGDVAVLTYTSGTTGPPKGAMNTHAGLSHQAQLYSEWFTLTAADTVGGIAPLFHITGIVAHMGVSMFTGAPLVLDNRFDAGRMLQLIEQHGITFLVASITAYIALLDHPSLPHTDLSSLRAVASGGAPVSPSTAGRWAEATGVHVLNIYGLTETTSPSHMTPPETTDPPVDPESGALSIGVPVPGAMVEVVDPETREPLSPGEVGELVIAGPMVVPGYWDQPEASAHAIPDGRLHTGDAGFTDAHGWYFLVDRLKDQINAGGYKVWPREVEDVLYTHPAVREAAVVGVPDDYRGETVKAVVSLVAGATVTPVELIDHCRQRLAAYKYPRQVEIVEELPKTASGKLLRRALRTQPDT